MAVAVSRLAPLVVLALACNYSPTAGPDDTGIVLTEGTDPETAGGASSGEGPEATGTQDGCEDACEAGAASCEGQAVTRCVAGDDGCRAWVSEETCSEGQVCSEGACAAASGFAPAARWVVPDGGRTGAGFATESGEPLAVADDAWDLFDLDGDGALDLVLTAVAFPAGDGVISKNKGFPLKPFWQFHRGGGAAGFADKPEAWLLPVGVGVAERGLIAARGEPLAVGDHAWALHDVDGDGRLDLMVTGVGGDGNGGVWPLGWPDAPRWDVYFNIGAGFEATAQPWALPIAADTKHFHRLAGAKTSKDAPTWALRDLDGDGWSDLVVSGRYASPVHVVPGFPDSPHWELYAGGAGGFVAPMAEWSVPAGGGVATGFAGGAEGLASAAATAVGDQLWALLDLDGDGRLELVVTGELGDGGPAAGAGWAVHRSVDSGFAPTAETVALPGEGGGSDGRGFYAIRGGQTIAGTATEPHDVQGWELLDVDGDRRLDLVVTNEVQLIPGGSYKRRALGADGAPFWNVYLGTDAGFVGSEAWPTPTGGFAGRGFLWSRGPASPVPEFTGTALWRTGDLDGDRRPEIVVTAIAEPVEEGLPWGWRVPGFADGKPHWQVHWQWLTR